MCKLATQLVYTTTHDALKELVARILEGPENPQCIRCWFRNDYYGHLDIYFEVGFYNDTEKRIDFGSSIDFDYDGSKKELAINYGTCGRFTKANIYQFKRAQVISRIYENIDQIESMLEAFVARSYPDVLRVDTAQDAIEHECGTLRHQIAEQRRETILTDLKVGDKLMYNPERNIHYSSALFHGVVTLKKLTPVYAVISDGYRERRIRKAELVTYIYNDTINKIKEDTK